MLTLHQRRHCPRDQLHATAARDFQFPLSRRSLLKQRQASHDIGASAAAAAARGCGWIIYVHVRRQASHWRAVSVDHRPFPLDSHPVRTHIDGRGTYIRMENGGNWKNDLLMWPGGLGRGGLVTDRDRGRGGAIAVNVVDNVGRRQAAHFSKPRAGSTVATTSASTHTRQKRQRNVESG